MNSELPATSDHQLSLPVSGDNIIKPESTTSNPIDAVFEQFRNQSLHHRGGPSMEAFYATLADWTADQDFRGFIGDVLTQRTRETNAAHFSNLIARAVQYHLFFKAHNTEYPRYTKDIWQTTLTACLKDDEEVKEQIKRLLIEKDTNTTVPQRYLSVKASLGVLFPQSVEDIGRQDNVVYIRPTVTKQDYENGLTVLDIGSSLAVGMRLLATGDGFSEVEDNTSTGIVNEIVRHRVKMNKGVAIDRDELDPEWVAACSNYFNEANQMGSAVMRHEVLKRNTNVDERRADILDPNLSFNEAPFDAATFITCLYQSGQAERKLSLEAAARSIKPGGFIIITDFLRVRDNDELSEGKSVGNDITDTLEWYEDWFAEQFRYRTVVIQVDEQKRLGEPMEFLQWKSGRCEGVRDGKDFQKVLALSEASSVSS